MSTILKALKQSEARRPREGSLPAGLPDAGRKQPARNTLAWLVSGLAVLGAAVGAWSLWPGGDSSPREDRAPRIAEVSMPERPTPEPGSRGEPSPAPTAAGESGPPAAPRNRPGAGTADEGTGRIEPERDAGRAGPSGMAAGEPSVDPGTASSGDDGPEDTPAREEPALDPHALLPRLEHLPAPRREALPKLNLNAHVFAPESEQSFVLINLARYREGDRVAPGLTVAEIFPGGVVMDDGEGRFVLPRP